MATVGFKLSILENGTLSSVAIGFSRVFINVTRAKCAWAGTTQLPNARHMILALKEPFGSNFFLARWPKYRLSLDTLSVGVNDTALSLAHNINQRARKCFAPT